MRESLSVADESGMVTESHKEKPKKIQDFCAFSGLFVANAPLRAKP